MIQFYPLLRLQEEAGLELRRQLVTAEGAHGAVTSVTGHRVTMMSALSPAQLNTQRKGSTATKRINMVNMVNKD